MLMTVSLCRPAIHPRLLDNWKTTLLPHIGGACIDTQIVRVPCYSVSRGQANRLQNFERIAMENMEAFFLGDGKPLTPVNNVVEQRL